MKRLLLPLLLGTAAVSFTSCIDQDQKFTLNPDGTGKLVVNMTVDTAQTAALRGAASGKSLALQLLRGTQGVEAWSDVSHETTPDGKTKLTGTAYFPDINKLQMSAGEQGGGAQASTLISKIEGGDWIVEMGVPTGDKPAAPPASTKTPAEVKAAVQQVQAQWQAGKAVFGPLFESAKVKSTVVAGGQIKSSVGFVKEGDSTGVLAFGGIKVLEALDKMMSDPKLVEDAVASGDAMGALRDEKRLQKVIMESMTDGKGMPKLVIAPGAAAFDYKAEVGKAKAGQSVAFKALLEEAKKPKDAVIRPPASAPEKSKVVPPTPAKPGR